jgi:hypothetical protein
MVGNVPADVPCPRVDLAQLVEEATEGCWIGHRARHSSEIGSVYSPRSEEDPNIQAVRSRTHVETVVDIGHQSEVPIVALPGPSPFTQAFLCSGYRAGWWSVKKEALDAA